MNLQVLPLSTHHAVTAERELADSQHRNGIALSERAQTLDESRHLEPHAGRFELGINNQTGWSGSLELRALGRLVQGCGYGGNVRFQQ